MNETGIEHAPPLMAAHGFSKTFGANRVLCDVDLAVMRGEVRGLVGENGSGKSTFIKVLTGVHTADPGATLELRGRPVTMPIGSGEAARVGLGVMHQDLGLEPTLSVTDNFLVDGRASKLRRIHWGKEDRRVDSILRSFGLDIDVREPAGALGAYERAVVAMARAFEALEDEEGVLVLDEPTAALERQGVEILFEAVRAAQARGCGVLFVSHDLGEVRSICDTVSVLRDGTLVENGKTDEFTEAALIRAIVGRDIGEMYPPRSGTDAASPVVLGAQGLAGSTVRGLSLELHAGEVLGLTGLAGMGQDEVPSLLYGSAPLEGGRVELLGQLHRPTPQASLRSGMVLLPADRKGLGGDPLSSVSENLTIPILGRYFRAGRVDQKSATKEVYEALAAFGVRPLDPDRPLGQLSGGNQQKALLAKWMSLFGEAKILLLHEPTQGVDVGSRHEIFQLIRQCAREGRAILYISTEYDDLAHLCDRVIVMRHGKDVAEIPRGGLSGGAIARVALASGAVWDGDGSGSEPAASLANSHALGSPPERENG